MKKDKAFYKELGVWIILIFLAFLSLKPAKFSYYFIESIVDYFILNDKESAAVGIYKSSSYCESVYYSFWKVFLTTDDINLYVSKRVCSGSKKVLIEKYRSKVFLKKDILSKKYCENR